ncbi:branched-chain amino acid ABC transporter substrate-binding protein [Vulcanimicrobium alpinum]|uniref:Branched-chain amino acid ABC transporter substrate-binding protein n=1 Tax=Vulcanimicrobium alpinum TaxID=3016050 RepID=A0AAN1XWN9_UNVUL|nr:branched-chain amino acid ABC transporter substrate-binding protein [Vulcanimicrobium alpinum]
MLCTTLTAPIAPVSAAGDTIVFGSPVSLTGSLTKEGHLTQEGYEFWKDYVNSHGGIKVGSKSYKVEIKYYDDESKPATAAQLAERLIDQDHVNFILGPYGSGTAFTVAQMVERKKIPMVEGNGAAEKIFSQGFRYTFGVLSPARRYLEGVLEMATKQKPRPQTVAITAASDAFSQEVAQGAADWAAAHGLKVVYNNKYPDTATDVSSIVSALKATNPDIILNAGHLQDALLVQKGLKEQNVSAKIYGYSVGPDTPDFTNTLGKDANGVYGGAQWSEAVKYKGDPGFYRTAREYAEAFDKVYHHRPDYHDAESTATCLAFQYAIEKAGSLEPEKVRNALTKLDQVTFYGILKFDSRGLNVFKPMVVNQIQNQKLVTVWPSGLAAAPPKYPTPPWGER